MYTHTFVPQDRQDTFDSMSVEKLVYFTTLPSVFQRYGKRICFQMRILQNSTQE